MITELNSGNFDAFIASDKPVLVDFWAVWCGPCKMLSPLVDALAEKLGDAVAVGKVNVDDESDLAARFGIQSIPTLLLFRKGELVNRSVGVIPATALEQFVTSAN